MSEACFPPFCSSDYLEIVKSTQEMDEGELRKVSANYDAVYFHPVQRHENDLSRYCMLCSALVNFPLFLSIVRTAMPALVRGKMENYRNGYRLE